jgi:flagellar biogenesis protein FliO
MSRWQRVGSMACFVSFLTLVSASAVALDKPTDKNWLRPAPAATATNPGTSSSHVGRWTAAFVLIGLSGLAFWKRQQTRRVPTPANVSRIQVTAFTKISPKAQLLVATVNGRSMLLGVTESNITRLMWLENAEVDGERQERRSGRRYGDHRDHANDSSEGDLYPLPRPEAKRVAPTAAAHARATKPLPVTAQPAKSRFREILADAIGLTPKPPAPDVSAPAPVDELLARAEDRYVGSSERSQTGTKPRRRTASGPLIDVEGQAAGLVARLNRPAS